MKHGLVWQGILGTFKLGKYCWAEMTPVLQTVLQKLLKLIFLAGYMYSLTISHAKSCLWGCIFALMNVDLICTQHYTIDNNHLQNLINHQFLIVWPCPATCVCDIDSLISILYDVTTLILSGFFTSQLFHSIIHTLSPLFSKWIWDRYLNAL